MKRKLILWLIKKLFNTIRTGDIDLSGRILVIEMREHAEPEEWELISEKAEYMVKFGVISDFLLVPYGNKVRLL